MEQLRKQLTALRMKGAGDNLDFRLEQATEHHLSFEDFLSGLLEDELIRRRSTSYKRRLKFSGLDPAKSIEQYSYENIDDKQKEVIQKLALCDFIERKEKLIVQGPNGAGKSFLLNAIGLCALEKEFDVLSFKAYELVQKLIRYKQQGSLDQFLHRLLKTDLILINEFAARNFPEGGTDELFQILDELDEKVSIGLTTNREFADWETLFCDPVRASAFTDRMINSAVLLKIRSSVSYRQKSFEATNKTYYGL